MYKAWLFLQRTLPLLAFCENRRAGSSDESADGLSSRFSGLRLLSIRSSDIAFTMGARGPLLEKADRYNGVIPEF